MSCKCNKPTCTKGCNVCETSPSAKCVIYKPNGGNSNINCFLKLPSETNLEKILETLDSKLCNLFTVDLSVCAQELLKLKKLADFKTAFSKTLDYLCLLEDKLVKVSATDNSSGYLYDKISLGNCLGKTIVEDELGNQTLHISIDYACLASKIPQCIEIDCCGNSEAFNITSNVTNICGSNTVHLSANGCLGVAQWYKNDILVGTGSTYTGTAGNYYAICAGNQSNTIEVTNSGACLCVDVTWSYTGGGRCNLGVSELEQISNCGNYRWVSGGTACTNCIPAWIDILPVEIFCGQYLNALQNTTSYNLCKMYIKQNNQCNIQTRWVEYTGSGSENAGNCDGCTTTVFTSTRTALFIKNDCDLGCVAEAVPFTRVYSSSISQDNAIYLKNIGLTQFNIDGQSNANLTGTCTNCECIPNGTFSCLTTGNDVTYQNSCNALDGVITFEQPVFSCSSILGYANIQTNVTASNNLNLSNYLIEYAITSIGGSVVSNPTYQQGALFANLADNTTYVVTCKVTRTGQTCTSSRTVIIGDCSACTDLPGNITISASQSSVCGQQTTTLTAVSSHCNIVEWVTANNLQPEVTIGFGSSITVQPSSTTIYKAICRNCQGNFNSNLLTITYTGVCAPTTYTSTQTRQSCVDFTKNNCQVGCGSSVNFCQSSTQTRTSTISQLDADNLAGAAASLAATQLANANGQTNANNLGTCGNALISVTIT